MCNSPRKSGNQMTGTERNLNQVLAMGSSEMGLGSKDQDGEPCAVEVL